MQRLGIARKWIIGSLFLLLSCAGHYDVSRSVISTQDGKYDSEYPTLPTSRALESISKSVYQISSLTFYKQFYFTQEQHITIEMISGASRKPLKSLTSSSQIIEKPAAGTATLVSYRNKRVGLLTCAHIVSAPDTLIRFFRSAKGIKTAFIERIDIRLRQSLNVIGLPAGEEVTILAIDQKGDLALIGKKLHSNPHLPLPVFNYPLGHSDELEMGVFVYLIGFPHGKKMALSSIVSAPLGRKNNFIVNATMHNGISGGLVLALRDGPPHFELVGIINALSAHHQVVLRPDPTIKVEDVIPSQPYDGNVYLDRQVQIVDGISFAIPTETIKSFLERQNKSLEQKGYFIPLELNQ